MPHSFERQSTWAARLYIFMARRRLLLAAATALVMGLSFWLTCDLKLDKSLKALLPDSSAAFGQSAELLDLTPFSRVMLVQLTAGEAGAAHLLSLAADQFTDGLNPALIQTLNLSDDWPEAEALMALLPALCDQGCLNYLTAFDDQAKISAALGVLKDELSGPGGLADFFWRADPLNWRGELFRHFPSSGSWPRPDPLVGYPLSKDGRHLLIVLKPLASMNDAAGSLAIMAELERLIDKLPQGLSAQVVGAHRHTAANASAIERDLALTLSLALILILAIYLLLVRSFGAFWLFLTPAVAVMLAAAGLSLSFPVVSGLALGFGAGVLGIAEDYAVHVHFALRRARDKTGALNHVARPLLMSTLLCVAGFGVLLFSSIPAIRQLAFFSAAAIVAGYLWAMAVLPHCPGMDSPREVRAEESTSQVDRETAGHSSGFGRSSGLIFLILSGISALLLATTPISSSIRDLGFTRSDIMSDQQSVEDNWRLDGGRRVYLTEGRDQAEALALAGEVARTFNDTVPGSAGSLAGLMPAPSRQEENLRNWRAFQIGPGSRIMDKLQLEAERLHFSPAAFQPLKDWLLAEAKANGPDSLADAGLGLLADNFLAEKDGRHFALVVVEPSAPPLPDAFAGRAFPLIAAEMEAALSQALADEKMLLPACVVICLLALFLAFRNLRQALLAFIPALGGLTAVLVFQLASGRPLGLVEMTALPLVVCLGADYGIVVVSELADRADLGAPMAIFVSGLSTLAGIGILILASHPVLHSLGKTVFIGLLAAMPISIKLLPKLWKNG